jgi:oligoribonuclease NrnB/cAMP/cGMP phosphodiesterase (DHH superfamily)
MNAKPFTVVYYHGDDADGRFAAYAAFKAYGLEAEYVPLSAGTPIPPADCVNRDVVVLDLAVARDNFAAVVGLARTLKIIDHHASSGELYLAHPGRCVYDPQHAACVLAWKHFHPAKAVPDVLAYVEDRDLWKFARPFSREVNAAIASYPFDWQRAEMMLASLGKLQAEGVAIVRYLDGEVRRLVAQAALRELAGVKVPVVNCPASLGSEVGQALLAAYPDAPFAATFTVNSAAGAWPWQLRSRKVADAGGNPSLSYNVAELAKKLGGGGHPAAAGFTAPASDPWMSRAALAPPPAAKPAAEAPRPPDGRAAQAPESEPKAKRK